MREGEPAFAGREEELQRLHAHLGKALASKGRVVFVTGETAKGKSRLVWEFARQAQERHPDLLYVVGECTEEGITDPFLPFKEIQGILLGDVKQGVETGRITMQGADRLKGTAKLVAKILVEILPGISMIFGGLLASILAKATLNVGKELLADRLQKALAAQRKADGEPFPVDQSRFFQQYTQELLKVAREHPLILAVDDLQWADQSSIDLLSHLGRNIATARLLILGIYTPQDVAQGRDGQRHPLESTVNELQRYQAETIEVRLGYPSSPEEFHRFVTAFLNGNYSPHAFDIGFVNGLAKLSEGHAGFLEWFLDGLKHKGSIAPDDQGVWHAVPQLQLQRFELGELDERIKAVIAERIARLEPKLRDLCQAASVQGETFTAQVLARVRGEEQASLIPQLSEELETRHGLIRSQGAYSEYGIRLYPYRFQQYLFQQYLYGKLSIPQLETLHAQTGQALEDIYAGNSSAVALKLAHHFSQAHIKNKALHYLELAASQQLAAYAYSEAIIQYDRALTFLSPEELKPSLYLQRAWLLRFLGRTDDGWESLRRAQDGFKRLDDPYGMALGRREEGTFHHFAGQYAAATSAFEDSRKAFEALGPEAKKDVAVTLNRLGETLRLKSDYPRAIETYQKALEIFDDLGYPNDSAWTVHGKAGVTREQGKYAEALDLYEDSERRFRKLDNPQGVAMVLYGIGDLHRFESKLPEALAYYEQALALAEKLYDTNLILHLEIEKGKIFRLMGNYKEAASLLKASLQGLKTTGNKAGMAYAWRYLGDNYRAMGKPLRALRCLCKALQIDEDIKGWRGLAEDHHWIGEIFEERGHLIPALYHIQKGLGYYEQMDFKPGMKAAQQTLTRIRMEQRLRERDAASASWTTGAKKGMGTAYTYEMGPEDNPSKVWFTLADGTITEVMYPTIDVANVRAMTSLVIDREGLIHDETKDCLHTISLLDKRALAYQVVSLDKGSRYRLIKEIVTDPANHTLLVQMRFEAIQGEPADYKLYLHYEPHVRNSGRGDSGRVDLETRALLARDREIFVALKTTPHWLDASLRHVLAADDALLAGGGEGRPADLVESNRISFQLQLPTTAPCTIGIGFGSSALAAVGAAEASLTRGFEPVRSAYIAGWRGYCGSLNALEGKATDLYYLSAMVVKASEDKTHRGAIVASVSLPWGNRRPDKEEYRGYRYVWPRDLYHSALALLAAGDSRTASAVLAYLDGLLQKPDGGFPQNAYVDATPYLRSVQMDEVAYPIILAWWLEATDRYPSLVKPAADYIVRHGPSTPQDRWEENGGYSPATIAAEIAGLVCAADLARRSGDVHTAELYLSVADEWQEKVERWCFTTNGVIGDGRYYLRISPEGDPNIECAIKLANDGGSHDQREVVDPSFLELVRLGVKAPEDPSIIESLPKVDQMIKVVTLRGPCWYRYNFDGYGEAKEGGTYPGEGHLWTLLTGERGMYELARGALDEAKLCLETMERFANEGCVLPEQVWEETGKGTGSATPLAWAHAEYIVLLKSIATGDIADRPSVVYDRYVTITRDGKT